MSASISEVWKIIDAGDKSALELRAFHYVGKSKVISKVFKPSSFESVDLMKREFELLATELNDKGYNIYTVMNSIRPDFQGGSAKDKDIAYRNLLLIDIDRAGATKSPAINKEVKAARSLAKEIESYLKQLGWPQPIQVMSGNGWHLYYKLDQLNNDDETTSLIRKALKLLAKRFNNSVVNIDTVVYNASRITKVPGTIARKGEETEDRPHRKAVVCE
jgi:hypothetical protein